jgi:hypothetical protein
MRAAPELLGAPSMGGGSARPRGGGGESYRSQISLQSRPKYTKTAKNGRFHELFSLKIAEKAIFALKYLQNKITRCFLRNT